jgi:ribulose-5-phosphate 4-epimerase/fuculose-1-phosphate aldolase
VGETLEETCVNAFLLEDNATKLYMALQLGGAVPLREGELKKHKPTSVWAYYVKKYDPMFDTVGRL